MWNSRHAAFSSLSFVEAPREDGQNEDGVARRLSSLHCSNIVFGNIASRTSTLLSKKRVRFWFPEASPRGRNVCCTPRHVSSPAISLFLSFAFSPQSISRLFRINLREIECKRQRCTHGRLEGRKAGRGNLIYGIIYFTMKGRGLRNPLTTTGQEGKGEEILTIVEIEKEREKGGRRQNK